MGMDGSALLTMSFAFRSASPIAFSSTAVTLIVGGKGEVVGAGVEDAEDADAAEAWLGDDRAAEMRDPSLRASTSSILTASFAIDVTCVVYRSIKGAARLPTADRLEMMVVNSEGWSFLARMLFRSAASRTSK
jgi:hypothetical protein